MGVTLAGCSEPCAQIALRVANAPGPALVFGTTQRLAPTDAAFVNGTASHALDFDDCSNTLGGHPSAPILPGLFALADTAPVSGRDLIAAYVAGFETETRIAHAVNFHHYDKGWHPTATLGVFGACVALLIANSVRMIGATMSLREIIATFASVLARNVHYQEISDEEWRREAASRNYNPHAIEHLSSLWRAIRGAAIDPKDPNYAVTDTIEKIGGARPKTFETFVREGQSELLAKSA